MSLSPTSKRGIEAPVEADIGAADQGRRGIIRSLPFSRDSRYVAVVLALAAALCNALSTVFERIGVETAPADSAMRWKLMAHVLRQPVWYLGLLSMIGAFGFQVFALGQGGLTLVQPLLVTELVFLVLILRLWFGRTLGWREAVGVVLTVAGLATFPCRVQPRRRRDHPEHGGMAPHGGCLRRRHCPLCRHDPLRVAALALGLVRRRRRRVVRRLRCVHEGDDHVGEHRRSRGVVRAFSSRMASRWRA